MMQHMLCMICVALLVSVSGAVAQSNIDPAHQYGWGENIGWTNWRDANSAVDGVMVDPINQCLSGYIWCENVGWLDVGDGSCPYANTSGLDFGINIDANDDLFGYAWGEASAPLGETVTEVRERFAAWGFRLNEPSRLCRSVEDILAYYHEVIALRPEGSFGVEG